MPYDQAEYSAGTPSALKQLLASGRYTTRKVTIPSGTAALLAGAVLGKQLLAAAATVTPGTPVSGSGGTVGNGAVGAWTSDAGAQAGTWYLEITAASTDAGKFKVIRPDGTLDGVGTVAVAYNGGINGTLADGANDWVVGDLIPIVVSYDETALKHILSAAAATDGSQDPDVILLTDCDASAAEKEALALDGGDVVNTALNFGTGHTADTVREPLRLKGINVDG